MEDAAPLLLEELGAVAPAKPEMGMLLEASLGPGVAVAVIVVLKRDALPFGGSEAPHG